MTITLLVTLVIVCGVTLVINKYVTSLPFPFPFIFPFSFPFRGEGENERKR